MSNKTTAMIRIISTLIISLGLFLAFASRVSAQVVINEFQLSPSNSQWIELFNKGADTDISGWIIDDSEGGSSAKFTIPSGNILISGKCLSFESGNFDWNTATADSVRLISNSTVIEEYSYTGSPGDNISIGKAVDGEGSLAILPNQSRNQFNSGGGSCLAPTPTPTPTEATTATATATSAPMASPAPTATPTKSPTPAPTKSPTPKPITTPTQEATSTSEVLGESVEVTPTPTALVESVSGGKKFPFLPIIFIGSGVLMIGFAVYNLIRAKKTAPFN